MASRPLRIAFAILVGALAGCHWIFPYETRREAPRDSSDQTVHRRDLAEDLSGDLPPSDRSPASDSSPQEYCQSRPLQPDGLHQTPAGWVYCTRTGRTLCTEKEEVHEGITRDQSPGLPYKMRSVLVQVGQLWFCDIWAVRGASNGYPFAQLYQYDAKPQMDTCAAFGFVGLETLGDCLYGTTGDCSNCGFSGANLLRYGNNCSDCSMGEGNFDQWVVQGPMTDAHVMSDFSGTHRTRCRVQ